MLLKEYAEQQMLENQIKGILKEEEFLKLKVKKFKFEENIEKEEAKIYYELEINQDHIKDVKLRGAGKGVVDALFVSLVKHLSPSYLSLKGLEFKDFLVKAKLGILNFENNKSSNAECIAHLEINNSKGKTVVFECEAFSMNSAAIMVVEKALEFFINAEIAFLRIHDCLKNAKKRHRIDLVNNYINVLSDLVKVTSYNKVLMEKK